MLFVLCVNGGVHARGFLPFLHSVKGDLGVKSVLLSIVTPILVVISRDAGPNGLNPLSLQDGSHLKRI